MSAGYTKAHSHGLQLSHKTIALINTKAMSSLPNIEVYTIVVNIIIDSDLLPFQWTTKQKT